MPRGKKYSIRREKSYYSEESWEVRHVGLKTRDDVLLLEVHDKTLLPHVRTMMESAGYVESDISKDRTDNK